MGNYTNVKPTADYEIGSGSTVRISVENISAHQYRFTAVGAGTADIQPLIGNTSTHKPETVQNDSIVLDLSGPWNFDVSASGGDVLLYFTPLI